MAVFVLIVYVDFIIDKNKYSLFNLIFGDIQRDFRRGIMLL